MTAYYYKGQKIITPYNLIDNKTVFVNESLNKKRTTIALDGQRFDINFSIEPSHDPSELMVAHMADFHKTETMIFPQSLGMEEKRTYNGNLVVKNNVSAGADQIVVNSTTDNGTTKKLPAGYFIKFSGHNKIYMVTNIMHLNSTNDKTLKIYPKLQKNVDASETVKFGDDVIYTYERDLKTARGMSFIGGVLATTGTINLVEKI
ncbi:hypothetical protein [Neptunicoccus sediminis]|uniref:hypothetical protein n=1 Tax=Neptunicoccus sediminis TaxID=1892596 RepID=UPI000845CDD3|nr:hypothetical protein [Neptunicoccus sediminis]